MGKKIDSIIEMHNLGLPAPKCIFIYPEDNIPKKIEEYLNLKPTKIFTIRTDREDTSMSHKRKLSASKQPMIAYSHL